MTNLAPSLHWILVLPYGIHNVQRAPNMSKNIWGLFYILKAKNSEYHLMIHILWTVYFSIELKTVHFRFGSFVLIHFDRSVVVGSLKRGSYSLLMKTYHKRLVQSIIHSLVVLKWNFRVQIDFSKVGIRKLKRTNYHKENLNVFKKRFHLSSKGHVLISPIK